MRSRSLEVVALTEGNGPAGLSRLSSWRSEELALDAREEVEIWFRWRGEPRVDSHRLRERVGEVSGGGSTRTRNTRRRGREARWSSPLVTGAVKGSNPGER
jgi:hypothetical protein